MFIISLYFLSPVLTLKDEHSSRVFEEGAEGKFDPKKNYVTGGWRNMSKGLINCTLPNNVRLTKSGELG
jgi:hypothetical protein